MIEDMLTPDKVAEKLSVSEGTLSNWRSEKRGPSFYKIGGNILYSIDDILIWIEKQKTETGEVK